MTPEKNNMSFGNIGLGVIPATNRLSLALAKLESPSPALKTGIPFHLLIKTEQMCSSFIAVQSASSKQFSFTFTSFLYRILSASTTVYIPTYLLEFQEL